MSRKLIAVAVALVVAAPLVLWAAEDQGGARRDRGQQGRQGGARRQPGGQPGAGGFLFRGLNLDQDQQARVRELTASQQTAAEAAEKEYQEAFEALLTPAQKARIVELKAARDKKIADAAVKFDADLKKTLTPDQANQYEESKKRMEGFRDRIIGILSAEDLKKLGLNDDQTKKYNDLADKYRNRLSQGFGMVARGAITQMREEFTAEVNKILTDEQRGRYEEIVKEQPRRGPRAGVAPLGGGGQGGARRGGGGDGGGARRGGGGN